MNRRFEFDKDSLALLREALERMEEGFKDLPPYTPPHEDREAMRRVLLEVAGRMQDNYPYFHPQYAGQMLKPPHAIARLAYSLAMHINPNNHALDGSRASSPMEKEAVAEIARMFGWDTHLGHLTSGGTMANLEALWVAGQLAPGKTIVASEQAHYTHSRISAVLKLPFEAIRCDDAARMDLDALEERLNRGGIGTVVATLGTTATGSVDPLPELLDLRDRYGFRLHADCAYGGYYILASNLDNRARAAFDRVNAVDSIVIDPHKHGLQPYGCGCVLFRDPAVGRFYRHDSPYTYFTSSELHLGEISLECSRAGASAVALWATQRLLPLVRGGAFAGMLDGCRASALELYRRLQADSKYAVGPEPELDIVVAAIKSDDLATASAEARRIFDERAAQGQHLALAELPARMFAFEGVIAGRSTTVTCLRSVQMKGASSAGPTHEALTSVPEPVSRSRTPELGARRAFWLLVAYVLVQLAVGLVGGILAGAYGGSRGMTQDEISDWILQTPLIVISLVSIVIGGAVILKMVRRSLPGQPGVALAPIGWRTSSPPSILAALFVGVGLSTLYLYVASTQLPPAPDQEFGPLANAAAAAAGWAQLVLAALFLAAAFVEEFLFRGAMFHGLNRSLGIVPAGAVITGLFVLMHLPETLSYIPAIVFISLMALAALIFRQRSGSLIPPIVLHGSYNLWLLMMGKGF